MDVEDLHDDELVEVDPWQHAAHGPMLRRSWPVNVLTRNVSQKNKQYVGKKHADIDRIRNVVTKALPIFSNKSNVLTILMSNSKEKSNVLRTKTSRSQNNY